LELARSGPRKRRLPNSPQVPAKSFSAAVGDRHGNFSGSGTVSVGGVTVTETVSGRSRSIATVGTIAYDQKINGQSAPPINITFVVSDEGDKTDGLVTDASNTFDCRLTRLSGRHER